MQSLDLRGFAADSDEFSLDTDARSVTDTLGQLSSKLPKLRCILVDSHAEVNPNALVRNDAGLGVELPLLLSISGCQAKIEASFFTSPYFRNLVYLDISDIPEIGTTRSLLQTIRPEFLPRLRVLKIQGHGMGDSGAEFLFTSFRQQLWSVDLGRNSLTDEAFKAVSLTFPVGNLRIITNKNATRSAVEGSLRDPQNLDRNGQFLFVEESEWSATFNHPDRYVVDAPSYINTQNLVITSRMNGLTKASSDSATSIKKALTNPTEHSSGGASSLTEHHDPEVCQSKGGITHLRLNENMVSACCISQLVKSAPGHLEHFECDSMLFHIPPDSLLGFLPPGTKLAGILGAAHLFRPVFSSNLQVLRIHHSLVTQILSIETDHLSERVPTMVSSWAAETFLLPRAEHTYPQAFTPDMNPRLRSLTLTKIPRYSTGPLIKNLIQFLKLASLQERAVQDAKASTRYQPQTLPGLRQLGLEFEHDPSQELEEIDSSFDGNGWTAPDTRRVSASEVGSSDLLNRLTQKSDRLQALLLSAPTGDQFLRRTLYGKELLVWVGSGEPTPHKAVDEYTRLAKNAELQHRIEPATPCHVVAGVPSGSYIFGAAWDAMMRFTTTNKPRKEELASMLDVIAAIKQFRAVTRTAYQKVQRDAGRWDIPLGAPHFFWTGEIQVSRQESTAYYTHSKFWR